MDAMGAPMGSVSPSMARISVMTPATGDGTSMLTLSVSTSTSGSYLSTLSPTCFSHWTMVPFGYGFADLRQLDYHFATLLVSSQLAYRVRDFGGV